MSAQVTITQLPPAGTIVGTELVPIVQNGITVHTTVSSIAGNGMGTGFPPAGIPNSSGSSWNSSYAATGTGDVVLSETPTINNPNLTGNISANVNLRNGNLDDLLQLAGGTSEVGYATDTDSLVLFTGTAGQAKSYGNYGTGISKTFTLTLANYAQYTSGLSQFLGTTTGTTLTVTYPTATINVGGELIGVSIAAGTTIVRQLTGSTGDAGTYEISISQENTTASAMSTFAGGSFIDCNHVSYLQIHIDSSLFYNVSFPPYYLAFIPGVLYFLNIKLPNSNEIPELKIVWEPTPVQIFTSATFVYALAYQTAEPYKIYTPIASDWTGLSTLYWSSANQPTLSSVIDSGSLISNPNITLSNSTLRGWSRYPRPGEGFYGIAGSPMAKIGYVIANPIYTPTMPTVSITGTAGQCQFTINTTVTTVTPLAVNQAVLVTGTPATDRGITAGTYYIIAASIVGSASTFTLSATLGGAAITTTAGATTGLTFTALMPTGTTNAITQLIPMGVWLLTGSYDIINLSTTTAFVSGEINVTVGNATNTISTASTIHSVKSYNIPASSRESGVIPPRIFTSSNKTYAASAYTLYSVASITSGAANIIINPRFTRIA